MVYVKLSEKEKLDRKLWREEARQEQKYHTWEQKLRSRGSKSKYPAVRVENYR